MKVVKVLWVDSCNSNMNWTIAEDIEIEPMYIDSFGIVVKDTDEFLAIAQNYGDKPEQYSNITTIPKGCIKEVFVIHEDNVCEKEQKIANKVEPKFKVKYAGSEYIVFETKNIAGVPFYGIEDEPNHIDYVQAENCEIINGGYGIKEGGFSIPTKSAMFSEQKSADKVEDEEYNGEDYGIDSLFHAQRILEKTLGKVEGYQSDDGILEHKCAITAIKKLYEQKPAEWSEKDKDNIQRALYYVDYYQTHEADTKEAEECFDWLKSLKLRNHWKPTEEQVSTMKYLAKYYAKGCDEPTRSIIEGLYEQLKQL